MNQLNTAKRAAVVAALVEGNSIRSTARMTDVSKPTILKLLADLGAACSEYHHSCVRNVTTQHVQCDEIWSFVGAKQRNVTEEKRESEGWGDVWTWTALDAETKLVISYMIGPRTPIMANEIIGDLSRRVRVNTRFQITTDGLLYYANAIDRYFGADVDYAVLRKVYGITGETSARTRYSPPRFKSATREVIRGNPDHAHISTSFIERQNLTMRMQIRRFTRLTNAFSKKVENHAHAVALHFLHYNFARIHKTLRVTPAMQAGLAEHVWSIEEIVGLLDRRAKLAA